MGAGELSTPLGGRPFASLLLRSLGAALFPMGVALTSPVLEVSLLTSPLKAELSRNGDDQEPMPHAMPVKLFRWKPLRSHFLHGLPDRSRARSPALMAPVLALGPSL